MIIQRIAPSILSVFLMAFVFCSAGCSPKAKPADVEQALRSRITTESEGRFKLASFKKTAEEGGGGVDGFCWAFEAEVECAEDGVWLFDRVTSTVPVDFRTAAAAASPDDGRPIKQGQRYQLVGAIYFSKGKKGWQADGVSMRRFPREVR